MDSCECYSFPPLSLFSLVFILIICTNIKAVLLGRSAGGNCVCLLWLLHNISNNKKDLNNNSNNNEISTELEPKENRAVPWFTQQLIDEIKTHKRLKRTAF